MIMRTIKFRGKRIDNGEWIYGDLLRLGGNNRTFIFTDNDSIDNYSQEIRSKREVIPETVEQFTELFDKNGREIYEGDIVMWGHLEGYSHESIPRKAVVEFCPDIVFKAYNINNKFPFGSFIYKETNKYLEIIGNTQDNPELITQK